MARTVIHKIEGKRTYARCKGRPGHRWDDHPNYDRPMHDWAVGRMVFRCSECGRVKTYEMDETGHWWIYYYDKPADYNDVVAEPDVGSGIRDYWSNEYFKQAFKKNGKG